MNRLDTERLRLFEPTTAAPAGLLRAAAIDVHRNAGWEAVAALWHAVQDDLDLPPPAVAINGVDGYQLWFSLAEPAPAAAVLGWLDALCQRYASAWPAKHFKLLPSPDATSPDGPPVPPRPCGDGHWSAFVAPGLAPMFADEPWLDLTPSADAQADLLLPLRSIGPADWARAVAHLAPTDAVPPDATPSAPTAALAVTALPTTDDPRQFLLAVMNDPTVALALRIDAAKALLPCPAATHPGP